MFLSSENKYIMSYHKHGYKHNILVEAENLGWNPHSDTYYKCDFG